MKQHYKAILLVIASSDEANDNYFLKKIQPESRPFFPILKRIYQAYMNECEDIKIFFVYGDSGIKGANDCDLVFDIPENDYPGIITKTISAMEYVNQNYDYDFIIRTNLSTFWDLDKLSKRLDDLPKTNCIAGTPIVFKGKNTDHIEYIAGHDIVFSKDLITCIIDHKEEVINTPVYGNLEDLSLYRIISKYMTPTKIIDDRNRCVAGVIKEKYDISVKIFQQRNADHYRVKNIKNRMDDKIILQRLLLETYGKTIF